MSKQSLIKKLNQFIEPVVESLGFELVDVELVKESERWFLRVYIYKEGGIDIEHCEEASKAISSILDKEDPINHSYILEVSSPGLDRPLKKEADFVRNKGKDVTVKLYKSYNGSKIFEGELIGLIDNKVVIKNDEFGELEFPRASVAQVKPAIKF